VFSLQVVAASALLAVFLMWASASFAWTQMGGVQKLWRVGLMGLILMGSGVIYFTALWASGMKLRRLLRH
jgi:putative peptidoglycan lipid II flippase